MCSLSNLNKGKSATIHSLKGNRHFLSRITAMGFTPGTKLSIFRNNRKGAIIVHLRDSMVAVGRKESKFIEVMEHVG